MHNLSNYTLGLLKKPKENAYAKALMQVSREGQYTLNETK